MTLLNLKVKWILTDDDFEVEVVDDTPKADRGRKASEPPN